MIAAPNSCYFVLFPVTFFTEANAYSYALLVPTTCTDVFSNISITEAMLNACNFAIVVPATRLQMFYGIFLRHGKRSWPKTIQAEEVWLNTIRHTGR